MNLYEKYPELKMFSMYLDYIEADFNEVKEEILFKRLKGLVDKVTEKSLFFDECGINECSIFLDEDLSNIAREFLEVVKPELYITEKTCGVYLKGVKELKEPRIRDFFMELSCKVVNKDLSEYMYENSIITALNYNYEEYKIEFISDNTGISNDYSQLNEDEKWNVCKYINLIFERFTCRWYRSNVMENNEYNKLERDESRVLKSKVRDSIAKIANISKIQATKFMVMYGIDDNYIEANIEIALPNYLDTKHKLADMSYIRFKTYKEHKHSCEVKHYSFVLFGLGDLLEEHFKEQTLDYLNKHKRDVVVCLNDLSRIDCEVSLELLVNIDKYRIIKDGLVYKFKKRR